MIKWIKSLFVSKRLRAAEQRIKVLESKLLSSRDEIVKLLTEQESLKEKIELLKWQQIKERNEPDGDMIRDVMLNPETELNKAKKV